MTIRRRGAGWLVGALAALGALAWVGPRRGGPAGLAPDAPAPPVPVVGMPTATPVWAGSTLAQLRPAPGGGQAIALQAAERGAEAGLLVGGFEAIEGLTWSPGGQDLAFAARRDGNWDLFAVALPAGEPRRLTAHPGHDGQPAWSPDGLELAYVAYREGEHRLLRLPLDGAGEAAALAVAASAQPLLEPAWSPDGGRIAFAAWHEGHYRLESVPAAGGERAVLAEGGPGVDLRRPAWEPGGDRLAFLERKAGEAQLRLIMPGDGPAAPAATMAFRALGFAWFPRGGALAVLSSDGNRRQIEVRSAVGRGRGPVLDAPGAREVAWSAARVPAGLAAMPAPTPQRDGPAGIAAERPGLVDLGDVRVPGARIHAGLAADFAALRSDVRAATGRDFLGTLSDMWRPVGFSSSASAFFSWHKTGRAFDTQMELRGPGGRRDMVLVREDQGGRTVWRMHLLAAAQDGSVGRPLLEPGWSFAAGSGRPELAAEGGERGRSVPGGYWLDFTALAEAYGWRRIPSLTQSSLDWRRDWAAIEYWHFERREGLSWYEAARQVYSDEELAAELHPERLRELRISLQRLVRMGFPAGWPSEG